MSYPVMDVSVPWSLVKNGFHKAPSFDGGTMKQKTAGARGNSALSLKPYATWAFELDLNAVLGGESVQFSVLQKFLGCFMATCGGAGLFLFTDPHDNSVDDTGLSMPQSCMLNVTPGAAPMAQKGDGASGLFQLARTIDQGVDILQNVSNVQVFVNGTPTENVTIGATGIVSFGEAPPNGAALTWSGAFQYLCRFTDDTLKDLAIVNKNPSGWLWSCGSVQFESEFV